MPRPLITSPQRKMRTDMIQPTTPWLPSQLQLHSVVGDTHFDTSFGGHAGEFCE